MFFRFFFSFLLFLSCFSFIQPIHAKSKKKDPLKNKKTVRDIMQRDPFGRYVLRFGRRLRKNIPDYWLMKVDFSQTHLIQWNASTHRGYRIILTNPQKKVFVPKPFPSIETLGKNTRLTYQRCSLHFFPRRGIYRAQENFLLRIKPARLLLASRKALIFLPNRFLHEEYPCPKIINILFRLHRSLRRGRNVHHFLRLKKIPHRKARRYPYLVKIRLQGRRSIPWRRLFRYFGFRSIFIEWQGQGQKNWEIRHKRR